MSGVLWLLSAALATWVSTTTGMIVLFLGGILIFPLTQLALKLAGRPSSLSKENSMDQLARQVAFLIPLHIPVIAGATLYHLNWFYPAFMIVVGAHYLPFVFLYGMWQYAVLAAVLWAGGAAIATALPDSFSAGGWFTAAVLLLFAVMIWRTATRRELSGG